MSKRNRSVNWGGDAKRTLFLAMSLIILLVLAVPGPTTQIATAKIQPILINLAAEEPDSMVEVIVQKTDNGDSASALAKSLGAVITKDLHILNAFAAQIPAQSIMELAQSPAVNWISFDGPVMKVSDSGNTNTFSYRSDFNEQEYDDRWAEIGEADGPQAGDVALVSFLGGAFNGLRIQGSENGIQGQFDLSEGSSAVLSFGYRRKDFGTEADNIAVEVSSDGNNWTLLENLAGPATDPNLMFASYDISAFTGGEFSLRFVSSANMASEAKFYLDYVQIEYQAAISEREETELAYTVMLPIVTTSGDASAVQAPTLDMATFTTNSEIIRDSFGSTSYSNNDGSVSWKDAWEEYDPDGGRGARGGYVYVRNGRLTFDWAYYENVVRHADLSGYDNATLSFDWQTQRLDDGEAISVLIAKDGVHFTELAAYGGSKSGSAQFDISQYLSANTAVKFGNTGQYWERHEYAYIDNVQIDFSSVSLSPTAKTVQDTFNTVSYANDDGSETWGSSWSENDPNGGGASGGNVLVDNGRLTFNLSTEGSQNITRQADLSTFSQALLTFDWQTSNLNNGQTVSVQISKDGSSSFDTLDTFTGSQNGTAQYDISNYLSSNTTVRFEGVGQSTNTGIEMVNGFAYFDNVQISYSCLDCIDTSNLSSTYVKAIRADQVWNQAPYLQGQDVTVAVVDSGIADHVDLTDGSGNSRILTHVQFITDEKSPDDLYGHGTHVAGSIAGNGLQSNGVYMGVAPKANLVDVKVIDDHGVGYTSDVVAGIQWIYDNHEAYNIRVVNLSLNAAVVESYDKSPLDAALEILWFNGITVVVSAGNNGDGADGYLYAPANDPFFITVGATDDMDTVDTSDDILASFSAHGNTQGGFAKPDVLTPGTDIISLLASDDSNLVLEHPDHIVAGPDGNNYFRMSGTSMSSAVASGVVALLLQDEPNLNPDQVKYRLMATGSSFETPTPGPKSVAYLDVPAAINGTTTETANTGTPISKLLWDSVDLLNWGSVNWGSVNWGSVNWGSVNWGSVNWGSVNWGSVNWGS